MRCAFLTLVLLGGAGMCQGDELQTLRDQLQAAQDEAKGLRQQRDDLLQRVVNLGDSMNQLQTKVAELEESRQVLAARLAFEKRKAERPGSDDSDLWHVAPVAAVVTTTKDGRIEISAGSDDGIVEGAKVEITRGWKTLGVAVVTKVTRNRSIAELVSPVVRKGDKVSWQNNVPGIDGLRRDALKQRDKRDKEWRKLKKHSEHETSTPKSSGS